MTTSINRFKWARENLKHENVQTVAKKLEIPRSLIDEIESDKPQKRGVSYLTVKKLADYYGVSMDWMCSEDLPLEQWSLKKDARIAAEYTGLSSAAVEILNKMSMEQTQSSSDTLNSFITGRMHDSIDFFLSNSDALLLLTQLYLYLNADFGMFFKQQGAEANSMYSYSKDSFWLGHDLFFSSESQFPIHADQTKAGRIFSFGFSESDYANLMLERIDDDAKNLRKEMRELRRKEIINAGEKKEEHDPGDKDVPD